MYELPNRNIGVMAIGGLCISRQTYLLTNTLPYYLTERIGQ